MTTSADGRAAIKGFEFNPLGENTYVIWCTETREAAIIDPGNYNDTENSVLFNFIKEQQLEVKLLLNTHAHIDHIFGNYWVTKTFNVPYWLHSEDTFLLDRSIQMAALWNLNYTESPLPDFDLKGKTGIEVGNVQLEIRHVPGHAPGHVIFIHHSTGIVIGGDTLFNGSIGRTDLPGGNHTQLLDAIKKEMFSLPEHYNVYSGHGPVTTIGKEKNTNPFF